MITDHKKYELFGKTVLQKIVLQPPFTFTFPVADNACFLYMQEGQLQYHLDEAQATVPVKHSLLLNCIHSGKQISTGTDTRQHNELLIVNFHVSVLKKIYDREWPQLLQFPGNIVSNQSIEKINNDFLIEKYMEGLLFYFENPSLVSEDILVLKLKEIILLLSQTSNAQAVQVIFSQLFSPTTYTFKQIIEAHLYAPISIEGLAQLNNVSVSSFKREFAKQYGEPPAAYMRRKKLEKAAGLLLHSDGRITDIAFACGFNDLANFTKSFREQYQMSPTGYRLHARNKV